MKTNRLESIQFLRGVAVLLVIAFHFRQYLNDVYAQADLGNRLFGLGEVGVDIFFVISGFIITYSTINREKNTPLEFTIKRFFRLYPLFIIVLSISIILNTTLDTTTSNIIKSYLLIPNDYNSIGPWYGYNINLPAWTLTYEILFYALFGIAISISHKYRTVIAIAIMISACSISQLYFRGALQIDPITRDVAGESFIRNFTFLSNPIIYDFIYGMIIAEIFIHIKDDFLKNKLVHVALVCILCISVSLIVSGYNRGGGIERWGFYSFLLVGSMALLSKTNNMTFSRFWVLMGEMSYSLYINHMVVKKLGGIYLRDFGIYKNNGGFTLFIILFILTFAMSYITYNLIEKPSVKLGHKFADRIRLKRQKLTDIPQER
ncbi:acyltransferase [Yersinia rochesterensis]|uniref:acyltransferase family protein n=1 Tax=Yersinia rochesterensis TaxID=1604335 RepID=UPI0025AAD074|nr:acyltransferase [Yersinia rochesterensis]MDN0108978.1 acyltransferase [Yersinia rochesterensis]